ncbi:hypothetical protein ACP70R_016372 [Stipagrostis hirtigluma subsp. patula]
MEEGAAPPDSSNMGNVVPAWVPRVGMKFKDLNEAWKLWVDYGGHKGFEVRKRYANERKSDGKITSCRYVCSKEGHRKEDKRDHKVKCPRAETRTHCEVRMGLIMDRETGIYQVSDVVLEWKVDDLNPSSTHLKNGRQKLQLKHE